MNKYSTVHLVNRIFSLQVYSEYNYVKRRSKKLITHLSLSSVIVPKTMYGSAYEIIELCPFDIDPAATTQQPITVTILSTVAIPPLPITSIAGALVGVLALIITAVVIVIRESR